MAHDERGPVAGATPDDPTRRHFLGASLAAGALALAGGLAPSELAGGVPRLATRRPRPASDDFELAELTVAQLQEGMAAGRWSARRLAELYLARIDALDKRGPAINQIIELNPDALDAADAMDRERRGGKVRGPLHGVPVLLKDNVATADRMQTTAGSLALVGATVPRDAFIVSRLREAGAVILGKTNLSEWANFRSTHAASGWSGRGGQTKNPYALDRTPSGSSSGSGGAAAASFAAAAVGTETDGSITSPAAAASLVGIKPTLGLVSRSGIVPIAHSQDTAGPMARTVADAAALLTVLAAVDPADAATTTHRGAVPADYARFLDPDGLRGARIGVARAHYTGYHAATDALLGAALDAMRQRGAVIVDPAELHAPSKIDDGEFEVLLYEFKADLNRYLASLTSSPVRSLADVIAFNEKNAGREMPYFGQEIMVMAQKKGPLTEEKYRKALARNRRLAGVEGIDATMTKHRLDALVAPTQGPPALVDLVNGDPSGGGSFTSPAAVAGHPHVTVPMGFVFGLPIGISFVGRAWSEPTLIRLAYAYEQATRHRKAPAFRATAEMAGER
ncbi:MAG: amidase [Gemmatimonadaceae bacterium]